MDGMTNQLKTVSGASYPELFKKFRSLASDYGIGNVISAYNAMNQGGFGSMYTPNPFVQNRRVKGVATRPADYTKNEVGEFITHPDTSEKPLRAVEKGLEYSAYPMYHTRTVYQNLLTYHSYIAPSLTDKEDSKTDAFWREWKLLEKLRKKVNPKEKAHEYAGRALQEGKIFVVPRVSVDKPHNAVNYAFIQRLPSDWTKIVGYNNVSKYTVAFDLMYFCQYGTDWRQFGDLFEPYINDWLGSLTPQPAVRDKKIVFAKKTGIDLDAARYAATDADVYYQNGRWFYWVTLPVDRVFPMEIDDTDDNVLPPFVGLFLDLIQLSDMEQIQLELLQNPLVQILHGEIETWDDKSDNTSDQYKISDAGRRMFEALWYQMLAQNSTSGIGIFAAPFRNMKMESLEESPNAINIVSQGYQDMMSKAGLNAIIPTAADARAGAVQVSYEIESQFARVIYTSFERMMNVIIEKLNLNYSWAFHMTGYLPRDEKRRKEIREELTLGIQTNLLEYEALGDTNFLDDIAISDAVIESEILNKRIPLVSSFHQSAQTGGRPPVDEAKTDGNEGDVDGGTAAIER